MGIITKVCRACGIEKTIDCYWRKSKSRDGLESRCKVCKKLHRLIPQSAYLKYNKIKKVKVPKEKFGHTEWMRLRCVSREDYIKAFNFLESIGYIKDSEKTIHEQFCEKYGLKPKNRKFPSTKKNIL